MGPASSCIPQPQPAIATCLTDRQLAPVLCLLCLLCPAAGMDNHIKAWSLAEHQHVLAASDEWRAGGPRAFPTGHVTMPFFSTEVGRQGAACVIGRRRQWGWQMAGTGRTFN